MQDLEPFYRWRDIYVANEDPKSPLFRQENESNFASEAIYNYYIHPLWDSMGSKTLFLKILYTDYKKHFAIIELMGEWNDAIENDIMFLKREIIDPMMDTGISRFILIAENVLNFHNSEADYYEEWFENVTDCNGWIVCLNMPEATQYDFRQLKLHYFIELRNMPDWRKYTPDGLFSGVEAEMKKRLR